MAAKIILVEGSSYEMTDINAWHAVRPIRKHSASLMIAGPRWDRWSPSGETNPRPLYRSEKEGLLADFRRKFGHKYNALSHVIREVVRHTGQILDNYQALAHVVKCGQCQKRLDEIYHERHLSLD